MATGSLDRQRQSTITHIGRGFYGSMSAVSSGSPQGNAEVREPEASQEPGPSRQPASAPNRPEVGPGVGPEWAEPHRITRARPTSAPTNGWSRSSTSVIWLILVRWTGPGGASSPTISPPSPTEPGRSRSSGSRAPGRPRRPRRSRVRRHRQPPRPRRPHPPRRPRPRSPLPRPLRLLPQLPPYPLPRAQLLLRAPLRSLPRPQLCSLPQAQLCFLPRAHPKVPRSAGCAARRPAPSPT